MQDVVGTVFRGHFETAGHMMLDNGLQVLPVDRISFLVPRAMHSQVVAYTGTDEAMFYLGIPSNLVI